MIRARLLWSSGLLEQFDDFGMTRHCRRHGGSDTRSGFQADIRTAIKKGLHSIRLRTHSVGFLHQPVNQLPGIGTTAGLVGFRGFGFFWFFHVSSPSSRAALPAIGEASPPE